MLYLITATHDNKKISAISRDYLKTFLGINSNFLSLLILDNKTTLRPNIVKQFDKVIATNEESYFFGSIVYGLKMINPKKDDRIVIYNTDSIIKNKNTPNVDIIPKKFNEVVCGRYVNKNGKQSYGAWELNESIFSPRLHKGKEITNKSKPFKDYICNSNLLSIPANIIIEIINDKIKYQQTYFDFVISKIASKKNYPIRIVNMPISIGRHDKDIRNKYVNKSSNFDSLNSPFNPLLLGIKVRKKYFRKSLISFVFYRLYIHFCSTKNIKIKFKKNS